MEPIVEDVYLLGKRIDEILADYPPLLKTAEVQAVLRCSRDRVDRLRKRGEIEAFQERARGRGSVVLFTKASLAAYLRRCAR